MRELETPKSPFAHKLKNSIQSDSCVPNIFKVINSDFGIFTPHKKKKETLNCKFSPLF